MMKSNSEVAVYSLCMLHIAIEGLIKGWLPCCGKTEQPQRTQAPSDAANMQKDECSHSVVSVSVLWSAVNRQLTEVDRGCTMSIHLFCK